MTISGRSNPIAPTPIMMWPGTSPPAPNSGFAIPGGAVELAEKAVKLAPEIAIYWNTLAMARYRAETLLVLAKHL